MAAREFRVKGEAYGIGLVRHTFDFTFLTNETDQELVWARARREAKKHVGADAGVSISSLKEER